MIQVRANGDKLTVSFDKGDPLAKDVVSAIERLLQKAGRTEELKALAAAKDDPPVIDPGG